MLRSAGFACGISEPTHAVLLPRARSPEQEADFNAALDIFYAELDTVLEDRRDLREQLHSTLLPGPADSGAELAVGGGIMDPHRHQMLWLSNLASGSASGADSLIGVDSGGSGGDSAPAVAEELLRDLQDNLVRRAAGRLAACPRAFPPSRMCRAAGSAPLACPGRAAGTARLHVLACIAP